MPHGRWIPALLLAAVCCALAPDTGQTEILLWPNGAPGSAGQTGPEVVRITPQGERVLTHIHQPSITPYLPSAATRTGAALILAPGGGHSELWFTHEGTAPAAWFQARGIAAFVLKYRLAHEPHSPYTVDRDEVSDILRALRVVRSRAAEWHLDTARVGVLGFSAGGELAALAAMRATSPDPHAPDPVDRQRAKPNFQVLIYPGSIGRFEVTSHAPPVFLAGGYADRPDIAEGMARLYLRYKQAGVPAELHIYAKAGHGFGLRPTTTGAAAEWPRQVLLWLTDLGILKTQ